MKLAIFGCGNISKRIAKSCNLVKEIDLVGFASKNEEKAREYALTYGASDYGDYDHFLNGDIDAVYVATYNQSHYELIKRALEHHKNVICEKPMLHSIGKTEEMFDLAKQNDVLLMEALKSVFLPAVIKTKQMMKDGVIGDITEARASFMRCGDHPRDHWINDPVTGGALKDLGTYCVGTLNYLFDEVPKMTGLESDATDECSDTTAYVDLDYSGVKARVNVSNSLDGYTDLYIEGTRGYIDINNFWKTGKGVYFVDGTEYGLDEECISDFYYELKHFADLVDNGIKESPVMSRQASIDILKITGENRLEKD